MLFFISKSFKSFKLSVLFQVGGLVRDYTFTRLQLHDGSIYTVKIISCNGAKLCTTSILQNLLIDSSAPVSGNYSLHIFQRYT